MREYHETRNRLSLRLFEVTDTIASYRWDTRSVEAHLRSSARPWSTRSTTSWLRLRPRPRRRRRLRHGSGATAGWR